MDEVTMVEFRRDTEKILDRVARGERLLLTRRGKPVLRLEPLQREFADVDPFYSLADLAVEEMPLDNATIDRLVYGE
ncbi:MAG: type II toxin-antitoxin system prevent-host-death family antitoxin [Candidatus Eremiobacteraeota bacterium]|nr:type II toxin-antitoxin system prevent-host-death family antitoxin [Candidatus Eremiobacteraeota bacterium]